MPDDPIRLVVDANIFISAFLKAATSRHPLLDERLELHAPADLLREVQKVLQNRFANRLKDIPDFDQLFSALTGGIHVVNKSDYDSFMRHALEIAPHEEDAPYLACALHLGTPLWSNDAELKDQNFVQVLSTTELIEELRKR